MPLVKNALPKKKKQSSGGPEKVQVVVEGPKRSKTDLKPKRKTKTKTKAKSRAKGRSAKANKTSSDTNVERGSGDGPHQIKPQMSLVALHFLDISLRHSDVQLLQSSSEGLNERMVAFYFAYLQQRRYRSESDLLFLPPVLVARLGQMDMRELRRTVRDRRLHEKPFLLLPLASHPRSHGHWSLLLVSRPDAKFYHYDSLDNCHTQLAAALAETLRAPLGAWDYEVITGRCLQQKPQICGDPQSAIHMFCMADHVADYVSRCGYATSSLLIAWEQINTMRPNLLQLIQSLGGFLPHKRGH